MNKKMKKDVKLSPSAIIAVGFLLLILTATLLLMLPISARNRQSTPLLTSLFTATSAVCVTGQALVDTGTHWSLFGQVVLIVAIQIGGLGVMTLMALVSMALGKRIGLRQRTLLQESVASISGRRHRSSGTLCDAGNSGRRGLRRGAAELSFRADARLGEGHLVQRVSFDFRILQRGL